MSKYAQSGTAHLVCPRLLELDRRHGEDPDTWPNCRRGLRCLLKHEHEDHLIDPEGHRVITFVWQEGSNHVDLHTKELTCFCGEVMVYGARDNPWEHPIQEEIQEEIQEGENAI